MAMEGRRRGLLWDRTRTVHPPLEDARGVGGEGMAVAAVRIRATVEAAEIAVVPVVVAAGAVRKGGNDGSDLP